MSKTWIGKIENKTIIYAPYVQADFNEWCKINQGMQVRVQPVKKPVSENMRGYYFSAVIPAIRSTCEEWENLSSIEIHEIVKKLFFYFETWNPKTKRTERFGRSVMSDSEWNNTIKAMEFLEIIRSYLAECGVEMPDASEYKRWRDSSPLLTDKPYEK